MGAEARESGVEFDASAVPEHRGVWPTDSECPGPVTIACVAQGNQYIQLMRFVKMVSIIMCDQLRTVCLNSLHAYVELLKKFDCPEDGAAAKAGYPYEISPGDFHGQRTPPSQHVCSGAEQHEAAGRSHPPPCCVAATGDQPAVMSCWGADMYSPDPPPMFMLEMRVEGNECVLVPSLETVSDTLLAVFDNVLLQVHALISTGRPRAEGLHSTFRGRKVFEST